MRETLYIQCYHYMLNLTSNNAFQDCESIFVYVFLRVMLTLVYNDICVKYLRYTEEIIMC